MELTCYEIAPDRVELRPAPRRRGWMDETPHAFAYHCLPLLMANLHGWEMVCPFGFEVSWGGGAAVGDLTVTVDEAEARARPHFVTSHFGSGILTFNPLVILRTPPGWNLWVGGPVNRFKDGIQAMTALVETDWMPFTFSMNWKLVRPGTVRFEAGEPFCAFFPVQRGVVGECQPRLVAIDADPALAASYAWARARRGLDDLLGEREREKYQGWYADGEMPRRSDGAAAHGHETNLVARPFSRAR
jgi:hypothetical protein